MCVCGPFASSPTDGQHAPVGLAKGIASFTLGQTAGLPFHRHFGYTPRDTPISHTVLAITLAITAFTPMVGCATPRHLISHTEASDFTHVWQFSVVSTVPPPLSLFDARWTLRRRSITRRGIFYSPLAQAAACSSGTTALVPWLIPEGTVVSYMYLPFG